jgi:gamma-glutamyl:cysteine ligase YbdK (ATP-grasp superfamily)
VKAVTLSARVRLGCRRREGWIALRERLMLQMKTFALALSAVSFFAAGAAPARAASFESFVKSYYDGGLRYAPMGLWG